MRTPSFDAVLCDLDGVVRHWAPDQAERLDREHGLPPGTFAATAFGPELLLPAITGVVTDEQWRASVAAVLAEDCGSAERARALVAAWSADSARVDTATMDLLTRVRDRVPVVIVTNATTRLERDLDALGIADAFDGVLNTARLGAAKPDPRVYRAAADMAGAPLHRCLFLDDTPRNVGAARALGMPTELVTSADDVRRALEPVLARP